jgi:sulfide:quinone oxidoreductase
MNYLRKGRFMKIVIIGAGTGGITVAARLQNKKIPSCKILLVDPAEKHFYQPLWTLVGAGVFPHESSEREMRNIIPKDVEWVKKGVSSFDPENNSITLSDNSTIKYDVLVVAAGMQLNWEKIKGAKEALNTPYVCSNYITYGSTKTWQVMQQTDSGNAIFTQPPLPIKCAGAPQKAAYLADDYFRSKGMRKNINVMFANNGPRIFGVEKYRIALEKVIKEKEIDTRFEHNLIEVKSSEKIAVFERANKDLVEIPYSMLHIVPPMSAPDFIKSSSLADAQGWVDVDKFTMQHNRFKNVFSLGDCSSLPTSRTGAAIRKEAPVLVENIVEFLDKKTLSHKYDGYSSCPLVTSRGKVILAEFDYDGKPAETFPFDQSKERWSMWLLKAYLLPKLYWNGMLKGRG